MAFTENTDRTTQWNITSSDDTWIVGRKARFDIVGQYGIDEGVYDGSNVLVRGAIEVAGLGYAAVRLNGGDSVLSVAAAGEIRAKAGAAGFVALGEGTTLMNDGVIRSQSRAVSFDQWGQVTNTGEIRGKTFGINFNEAGSTVDNKGTIDGGTDCAISAEMDAFTLTNRKGGVIESHTTSLVIYLRDAGEASIINAGEIRGEGVAIGAEGTLFLTNRGHIAGDVYLGAGNSTFDGRNGTIDGAVFGGLGDDTFRLSNTATLNEQADSGNDRVFVSVSYRLSAHIEELHLTGTRSINGTGSNEANVLQGNTGDNRLSGLAGVDMINGGGGKDRLIGGEQADIFVFNPGNGRDVIADFEDGSDRIAAEAIASENDFNVYKFLHMKEVGSNVMIDFGGGDRLVIEDLKLVDLSYADFT